MAKKTKRPPLSDEQLLMLRDTSRSRVTVDGLDAGTAVMYLDPKLIDRLTTELIKRREKD